MIFKPKKRFEKLIIVLDKINPVIVLISIVGLVLEYTTFKSKLLISFNSVVDVIFVIDFSIRLMAYPAKLYFINNYGWVDFLASIPGFMVIVQLFSGIFKTTPVIFRFFKFVRIGRFFKIIRILRFLRIFKFLKKMKAESVFIQNRIMKIGISIVLTLVVTIGLTDHYLKNTLINEKKSELNYLFNTHYSFLNTFIDKIENIKIYQKNNKYYDRNHKQISENDYVQMIENENVFELSIKGHIIGYEDTEINRKNDKIIFILIISLIMLLVIIIFYIGFVFAKDIRLINLIIDSIDADDYMLLVEEGKKYCSQDRKFIIESQEDEIISLFKMANKLILENNIYNDSAIIGGMPDFGDSVSTEDFVGGSISKSITSEPMLQPESNLDEIYKDMDHVDDTLNALGEDIDSIIEEDIDTSKPPIEEIPDYEMAEPSIEETGDVSVNYQAIRDIVKSEVNKMYKEMKEDFSSNNNFISNTAVKAVKIATKSIVDYLKKNA